MAEDIAKLLETQISLSEWFEKIGHANATQLREEDNEKRERLKVLHDVIGLPFDQPFQCMATDVANNTLAFTQYLSEHGGELCAMRLIPLDPSLPKLRMRGKTVRDVVASWFPQQAIDPVKYRVDFIPHPATHAWSAIFVINQDGIFGEIIVDSLEQLSQGFYHHTPISFAYDFHTWMLSENNSDALKEIHAMVSHLSVTDSAIQKILQERLAATFTHGYLCGYFEAVNTADFGRWFIDYNRILGATFTTPLHPSSGTTEPGVIQGQCGAPGKATGTVRIVQKEHISETKMSETDILVCDVTSPEYLPLMQKAAAIVTNRGGILSHAAIVSRELGKPCVVGTGHATEILKEGEMIEVDAERGIVKKIT
ncbi:MAG: PEP-utilizing enzyme [Patescibacteria group bacterium]